MSQVSTPIASSGSLPAGSSGPSKVNRESLQHYLVEAAHTMRRVELGVGITGWLCVLVIFLLAAILIDHWLWPLNTIARFAVLIFLVGWSLWWVPQRILPLLFQSIHPEHAARKIEKQHPEMKESLISWLQLTTNSEHTAPRGVLATVGRFAIRNLGGQDSNAIIDSANLIRLAALLFGFLLTGSVYLFASPKSGTTSLARMLMPWSNIAPAARVRIVSVAPGTTTITQGTSLPISVTLRGMHKGDHVFVRYDLSDGQQVGQRLKMTEDIEGVNYRLDFGKSFGGIHQPLSYWIDAGDASAGPFALSVQVVPIVAIDRMEFEYPKYTRQKSRTVLQDGTIEAPEGTRVKLFAHANQPMIKSRLEFDPIVGNGVLLSSSHMIDLETRETQLSGSWLLQLDKKRTNPTLSTYRVKATNVLNESNGDPVIYKIKVMGDLPPEVRLQSDLPSTIDVPLDDSFDIEMRAVDPDFGLVSLVATAKLASSNSIKDKKTVFEKICFKSSEGTTGQVVKDFTFNPSEYDLKVGDVLEFLAIATDNRCKVGEDSPEPNQSSSTPLEIRIVAASKTPAEKDKNLGERKDVTKPDPSQNQNGKKSSKGNQPAKPDSKPSEDMKSEDQDEKSDGKKPNGQEKSNEKQKDNNENKQDENAKKNKSQEKGSGQGQSGSDGESSDSESSNEGDASSNQKNGSNSKNSKSKSTSSSNASSSDNESSSEADDQSAGSENGTSSKTKSNSPSKGQQSLRNQEKDWSKPEDDAESFQRIDQLRKEREEQENREKQAGEKQAGEKQAGEKQAGEKQAGEKQAGEKQSGEKQAGEKQAGEKQAGEKQAGEKQAGEKQAGEKQSGEKQAGEKQSGEKQSGEKQSGEKQAGEKQSGEKQAGEKQSGEKQTGEKQAGEKQAGEKQSGEKQSGEKQSGEKQSGEKQSGEKQSGEKQSGEKQAGEKQAGEKQAGEKQAGEKQAGEKQAGEKQAGEKQSGEKQSGEKQAGEKQSGEKQSGEKQSGEKQSGEKQSGEKQSGEKQSGEKQSGEKSGNAEAGINKEGASSEGKSTKGSDTQSENREDPANKEYADKVTDLALDYLKQQKDQPDPELLKRLKWSDEDLKKFLDRWTEAKELAKTDPNKKRELDETLKSLSKRQFKSKEQDVKERNDELKGFLEEGTRVRPPESLRPGFEQFRKAAGKL